MDEINLSEVYRGYIACLNKQDWSKLGVFVGDDVKYNGQRIGLSGYREMLGETSAKSRTYASRFRSSFASRRILRADCILTVRRSVRFSGFTCKENGSRSLRTSSMSFVATGFSKSGRSSIRLRLRDSCSGTWMRVPAVPADSGQTSAKSSR